MRFLLLAFLRSLAPITPGTEPDQIPAKSAAQTAPPPITPTAATTGEVLQIAKLALEESFAHTQRSLEQLKLFGSVVVFIVSGFAGLLAFFGLREVKSITKPLKEKIEFQSRLLEETQTALDKAKSEHREIMARQVDLFVQQSKLNSKALVIASTVWDYISRDEPKKEEMEEIVRLVRSVVPENAPSGLDSYIEGVLMIRIAFALKRLGNYRGAYTAAKRAISLDGAERKQFWYYNLACYAALTGRVDEYFEYARIAIESDPDARADLAKDPDLAGVREDSRFAELLS